MQQATLSDDWCSARSRAGTSVPWWTPETKSFFALPAVSSAIPLCTRRLPPVSTTMASVALAGSLTSSGIERANQASPRAQHGDARSDHGDESRGKGQQRQYQPVPGRDLESRQQPHALAEQHRGRRRVGDGVERDDREREPEEPAAQAEAERLALELPGDIAVLRADEVQYLDDGMVHGEAGARGEDDGEHRGRTDEGEDAKGRDLDRQHEQR